MSSFPLRNQGPLPSVSRGAPGVYARPISGENRYLPRPSSPKNEVQMIVRQTKEREEARRKLDRKKARNYSVPVLKSGLKLAWHLSQYRERSDSHLSPFLVFDISQDPNLVESNIPPFDGLYLLNGDKKDTHENLQRCFELPFAPDQQQFTKLIIKCDDEILDKWDVIVEREEGIRVIDVFRAIHKAYHTTIPEQDYIRLRDLIVSVEVAGAASRRSLLAREAGIVECISKFDFTPLKVDLLLEKTLFNGIFFNAEINQYHFRLLDRGAYIRQRVLCVAPIHSQATSGSCLQQFSMVSSSMLK
ncbi:hypothetical protein H0H92_004164 [Tricholoma furcatifolium]|nr:hypothetical protein H0H92_004164 [Tricholoma furcatifolium]